MKHRHIRTALLLAITCFLTVGETVTGQEWMPRGITEPYKDATLSAIVAGTISVIRRKEGEFVKKGAVILELENKQEALEIERRKLIAESKVEVQAAQNRLETLKLNLESTRKLSEETRSVSQEELQAKELEYKLAEAELEKLLIAEKREDIEYKIAEAQLQKRIIRAPFSGVIIKLYLEEGENCNPQQPLVRIADTRKCRLIVHMETASARRFKSGMQVKLVLDEAESSIILQGVIDYVSPVVDPSSGLREVKVLFDNSKDQVHPGVTGTLVLEK